ncbi:MAG TPA: SCO family protein, partial [Microvirga sp.]|nr:SCO family protein [Microvirga sp.]
MTGLRLLRLFAWAAVAVLVLLVGWTVLWHGGQRVAEVGPPVQIGGPFSLVDQNGRPTTEADLAGRPTLLFFGFTHCPEVCPTTLYEITGWMRTLGAQADGLNVVFVTVDPERDDQAALAEYAKAFDPRIRMLTGTPQAVDQMIRAYRAYVRKVPLEGGGYTMD